MKTKILLTAAILMISSNSFAYCAIGDNQCEQSEALIRAEQQQAQSQQDMVMQQQSAERERQIEQQRQSQNLGTQWIH